MLFMNMGGYDYLATDLHGFTQMNNCLHPCLAAPFWKVSILAQHYVSSVFIRVNPWQNINY